MVAQAYKVDVEVLGASRGCTAILRCVVPTFVKELVRVVSWVQEPALYIYPSLQGGNNHSGDMSGTMAETCMCVFSSLCKMPIVIRSVNESEWRCHMNKANR